MLLKRTSWLTKERIVFTAVILIMLTAVFFIFIPIVRAGILADLVNDLIGRMLATIYNGILKGKAATITGTLTGKSAWDDIQNGDGIIGNVMSYVGMIAGSLYFIYILVLIIQQAGKGELNFEYLAKVAVKAIVALMLIIYSPQITEYLGKGMMAVAKGMCDAVQNGIDIGGFKEKIMTKYANVSLNDDGTFASFAVDALPSAMNAAMSLVALVPSLIFVVVIWLISLLGVDFIAYGLLLEVALRKTLVPLAMVGVLNDGSRSPAVNYLKKFAGVYLRIGVYALALTIGDCIAVGTLFDLQTSNTAGLGSLLSILLFPLEYTVVVIAAFIAGKKGGQIIDEALGYGSA